jgi:anthranilate synthase component 1
LLLHKMIQVILKPFLIFLISLLQMRLAVAVGCSEKIHKRSKNGAKKMYCIVVKDKQAAIFPIAGTFRRTGNDTQDAILAETLLNDPKENAEHIMLVDLARNDLSRHGDQVKVETLKEVQYYSHVIHLVSKVVAQLPNDHSFMSLVADTFPAGTLSGAPKHNAMKLINRYEHGNRGFYGGCIGYIGFDGVFNHAIMIRTIMSKDNVLYYQAGAGVVDLSVIENEAQEVHNKLAALKKAIVQAVEV